MAPPCTGKLFLLAAGGWPPAQLPSAQPSVGLGRDLLELLSPRPIIWALGAPGWVWRKVGATYLLEQ